MFIQTQDTPNPSVIKFLAGQTVLAGKTLDIRSRDKAVKSPLAQRLFALTGVAGVFLGEDFVSITKDDNTDWSMLKPMIITAMMEHLATNQPVINEDALSETSTSNAEEGEDSEIVSQIKILLEERVRPAVAQDGGDIVFHHFDDGIVYLQMRGACAGCPSSTMTLKSGIENMLRHYIPEVNEVRAVNEGY